MNYRRYTSVARAHQRRLVAIVVGIAVLGLVASFVPSPAYAATATVRIATDAERSYSAEGVVAMARSREIAEIIATDLHLVSRPVATGVDAVRAGVADAATSLSAYARYGYKAERTGVDAAAAWVQNALQATIVPGGEYVLITASAPDPELASAVANQATAAVIAHSRALAAATATERARFLDSQVAAAKQRADTSRQAVLTYALQSDAVQGDSLRASLANLDSGRATLAQKQLALTDAKGRLAEIEAQLAGTPQSLVFVTQGTGRTTTSASNPVYQSLAQNANATRQEIASLEASQAKAEALVNASDQQFRTLLTHDSQLTALNSDLVLANEAYGRLSADLAQARSDQVRPIAPIRSVARAVAPDYPAFPIRTTFVAVGLAAGILIAMVVSLLITATDKSLRSPADVEAVLRDVRMLAVVPTSPPEERDAASHARARA